ncbi:MAG: hypothetical protein H7Y20_18025 [Bryobacteraceae bacterium]|nr:hypothetical protein [Bryobacteraceae bacterium]
MNKTIAIGIMLAGTLFAQSQEAGNTSGRKVVEVRHLSGARFEIVVSFLNQFMLPGQATYSTDLKSVLFRGSPEAIVAAEALLKKFDVPQNPEATKANSTFQFRIYLVEASPDEGQSGATPSDITSAVDQMKKNFQYKSYRLLDTLLMQSKANGVSEVSGILPSTGVPLTYEMSQGGSSVDENKTILIRSFKFVMHFPVKVSEGSSQMSRASIHTDLTIRQGQKLVVGKLSKDQSRNAMFLIITADIQ